MLTSGVLRILNGTLDWMLTDCCPDKKQTDLLKHVLKRRSGLFLVSGPTGSGKTTTLYAMLNELSPAKIFTLEDRLKSIQTASFRSRSTSVSIWAMTKGSANCCGMIRTSS